MAQELTVGTLVGLSDALAAVVERVAPVVARVDDGSRLTASGVVWSPEGVVVTSSHGVERDEELAVELADGTRRAAELVGRDADTDLAVLRVERGGLPAALPEANVRVGHLVLALGRPGTTGLQATLGIVSARFETERGGRPGYILHTDAVLYPGFSGGALVDGNGHLAGLTNLLFGRGRGVAVGVPVIAQVTEELLAHGQVRRGFLGITTQSVTLPGDQGRGVMVLQVQPGSPAEQGGLLLGDVLLRLCGEAVEDPADLRRRLRGLPPGQEVEVAVLRGGEPRAVRVTLGGG